MEKDQKQEEKKENANKLILRKRIKTEVKICQEEIKQGQQELE